MSVHMFDPPECDPTRIMGEVSAFRRAAGGDISVSVSGSLSLSSPPPPLRLPGGQASSNPQSNQP